MKWWRLSRLGPWWIVAAVAAAGIGVAALGLVRPGGYVLTAALVLAAVLRGVLSHEAAGGIAVRRRWLDVVTLTALGFVVGLAFTLVGV